MGYKDSFRTNFRPEKPNKITQEPTKNEKKKRKRSSSDHSNPNRKSRHFGKNERHREIEIYGEQLDKTREKATWLVWKENGKN